MLVLNRRQDEELIFFVGEEEILVRVLRIKSNQVLIGIEAPKDVTITRKESRKYNPNNRKRNE